MNYRGTPVRIAVLGDSISEGLGSKKYNYCPELRENVEEALGVKCTIRNFAYTGKTILYANEIRENVAQFQPDIIISFFGSVDGMVRPKKKKPYWYLVPNRYKQNGMLDPRPFYSRKFKRAIVEHIDSFIRFRLKLILMKLCGTYSWVDLTTFEREYRSFLDYFKNKSKFLLASTVYLDDYYFPGSNDNFKAYNECIKNLSEEYHCNFIDLRPMQRQFHWEEIYDSDHFHPSQKGYTWYAQVFGNEIVRMLRRGDTEGNSNIR
ncbi:SGNH/GDSL hydrolase family protein [Bacillus infantis]|uniref:SGNH/GDSL hydrolase family protein n=1 Tax=Bacillus infantis TaxID=324767 RepID=UPI00398244F3